MIVNQLKLDAQFGTDESFTDDQLVILMKEAGKAVREVISSFTAVDWDTVKITVEAY